MKLNILSHLHLGFERFERPVNAADIVILAGDMTAHARPLPGRWVSLSPFSTAGDHEFYGSSLDGPPRSWSGFAPGRMSMSQ